ncbi:GntR family transcriptional regulator [Methylocapsa sp. S129]|uniref:GntR family transcriptional regulator n=1 Tax=Methylocapsa sp. S129 TaxID=1641869 RepID=UPI00131D7CC1|nr:GntR family transcriptional regulator [Methylocapsa sp. S129]
MKFHAEDVRPVTTAARVYAVLRQDIVTMRVKPGAMVVEKDLCQMFGVSRTPLREALLRLSEEQLVVVYPQTGTFVSRIAEAAVRDAMAIRQALEQAAARYAASRAEDGDIERLRRILVRQKAHAAVGALDEFHEADEALHQAIAEIARHPNIWRVVKREKAQIDRFRLLTLPLPARAGIVIAEHEAIVEAIAAHDPGAAEAAMQAHLESVLPVFEEIRRAHPDLFEPETLSDAPRPRRAAAS